MKKRKINIYWESKTRPDTYLIITNNRQTNIIEYKGKRRVLYRSLVSDWEWTRDESCINHEIMMQLIESFQQILPNRIEKVRIIDCD